MPKLPEFDTGACTIQASFAPTATGSPTSPLTLQECPTAAGGSCTNLPAIELQGTAITNAAANPATLDFGSIPVNTSSTLPDTITVDAGYSISTTAPTGVTSPFSVSLGTCAGAAGTGPGTCTIQASFAPTAAGSPTSPLTLDECPTAGGGSCVAIPVQLQGTATGSVGGIRPNLVPAVTPSGSANPSTLAFGAVGVNTTKTLSSTITVDAGYTVESAGGTSGLNPPFGFQFGTCGVPGGFPGGFPGPGSCTINETFTPTSTTPASGEIDVFECPTAAAGACISIPIQLSGSGQVEAAANPATLAFGAVGVNTTKTLSSTITVDAGYTVESAGGTSGLNPPFGFQFGTCGVPGGFPGPGSCTINETFTPTSTTPASGEIDVFECPTAAAGACISIPIQLSGSGTQATTTTALTSSANPSLVGQSITLTAKVTSASAATSPTGTVTFADGSTKLGTVTLSGGTASLTTSALAAGPYPITATYSGDGL